MRWPESWFTCSLMLTPPGAFSLFIPVLLSKSDDGVCPRVSCMVVTESDNGVCSRVSCMVVTCLQGLCIVVELGKSLHPRFAPVLSRCVRGAPVKSPLPQCIPQRRARRSYRHLHKQQTGTRMHLSTEHSANLRKYTRSGPFLIRNLSAALQLASVVKGDSGH